MIKYYDNWIKNLQNKYDILKFKKNESIKISNGKEKFWVKIFSINLNNNTIIGIVDNELILKSKYNFGDFVEFSIENILDYHSSDEMNNLSNYIKNIIKEIMIKNNCTVKDAIKLIYSDNKILNLKY
jgi:uncharacterized protein YegJ (DUF2314 family)